MATGFAFSRFWEIMEAIEIRSIEQDFEKAQQYVLALLKKQKSAESVVSEIMLVFEALCHDIFAQIKPENAPVTLLAQEKRGYVSIRFTFEGAMYIPGGKETKGYSPERKILEGYSDKIDYSYHSGYNKILLTVRNSYVKSLLPWAAGALLAIAVYILLLALTLGAVCLLRKEVLKQDLFAVVIVFTLTDLLMAAGEINPPKEEEYLNE